MGAQQGVWNIGKESFANSNNRKMGAIFDIIDRRSYSNDLNFNQSSTSLFCQSPAICCRERKVLFWLQGYSLTMAGRQHCCSEKMLGNLPKLLEMILIEWKPGLQYCKHCMMATRCNLLAFQSFIFMAWIAFQKFWNWPSLRQLLHDGNLVQLSCKVLLDTW